MATSVAPTRRDVWVGMLLYPAHTLPTAAAPVLVACGLAWHTGHFAPGAAALAFLAGWLIQLGGVITDNYFNLSRHADDAEHAAFVAALRAGVVGLGELRLAIVACYGAALLAAYPLIRMGGWMVLVFGAVCVAASLAYSAGPYPLGDHALGDPLFFLFFGVASVGGAYYVQVAAGQGAPPGFQLIPDALTTAALLASLPMAALITDILVIDNIRDLEYDRGKGERTLAVVLGPAWSRAEYVALLALAYAVPVWLWRRGGFGLQVMLPWLSLPMAVRVTRELYQRQTHDALIPMTPRAGRVALAFGALFALGLAL